MEILPPLGTLWVEVTVVGIVCLFFLALFIVAGIRQALKSEDENG